MNSYFYFNTVILYSNSNNIFIAEYKNFPRHKNSPMLNTMHLAIRTVTILN